MRNTKRWGATPDEWQKFIDLGLSEDLLPVVSNPDAPVSKNSTMKFLGKTPSLYNKDEEVVGIGKWTQRKATPKKIERWREEPDYGICIQTRNVRAFDIDVENEELVALIIHAIYDVAEVVLPVRSRANSTKCLLAFRMGGEHGKRVIKTQDGMVEFLANGQQFIAAGTHPSGERYRWGNFTKDPWEIPELTEKQFEAVMFVLESEFGIAPTSRRGLRKRGVKDLDRADSTYEFLEKKGLVLEYGDDGQQHIECPFADEHTTESVVSATSYFPAGSGGYEQGHFICLHAHCEGRTNEDFEEALGVIASEFEYLGPLEGRRKFEAIPLHEFVSAPSPSWMIKGILPHSGLAMIYGASGSGKSFLAIDIALSIALGSEWCGKKVSQGNVVYIAAEGAAGIRKRFKAYALHHSLDTKNIPISAIEDAPNLHGNDATRLLSEIQKVEGVRVVVVDTLAQSSPGADENSAKDMGAILSKCKKIQEETGALVILIHHSGKDSSKGARGWSGIFAAMDTVIEVRSNKETRIAKITKQKDGEDGIEYSFALHPITLGWDDDDDEITSCIVVYVEHENVTVGVRGKWQVSIVKAMQELDQRDEPVLRQDVISRAIKFHPFEPGDDSENPKRDRRAESVNRALNQLEEMGLLFVDDDRVACPQTHEDPQNELCGNAA